MLSKPFEFSCVFMLFAVCIFMFSSVFMMASGSFRVLKLIELLPTFGTAGFRPEVISANIGLCIRDLISPSYMKLLLK